MNTISLIIPLIINADVSLQPLISRKHHDINSIVKRLKSDYYAWYSNNLGNGAFQETISLRGGPFR